MRSPFTLANSTIATISLIALLVVLATARSAGQQLLRCSPEDYGARGDGTTLDTAAVQQAIDVCSGFASNGSSLNSAAGGTVLFAPGRTYLLGSLLLSGSVQLVVPADTVLQASAEVRGMVGKAATEVKAATGVKAATRAKRAPRVQLRQELADALRICTACAHLAPAHAYVPCATCGKPRSAPAMAAHSTRGTCSTS